MFLRRNGGRTQKVNPRMVAEVTRRCCPRCCQKRTLKQYGRAARPADVASVRGQLGKGKLAAVLILFFMEYLMNKLLDLPPVTWIERLGVYLASKRASQAWALVEDSPSTNSRDPEDLAG